MDLGQWVVIGVSVAMGVWYLAAAIFNRRRGLRTYYWMRKGLEGWGKISEARWIGSSGSGARLVVSKADPPFRRVETVYLLETREILPLWLFNRLRGKQDEMIIKATIRTAPRVQLEVALSGNRELDAILDDKSGKTYRKLPNRQGFDIIQDGDGDQKQLGRFLEKYASAIRRISIQRKIPHLVVRTNLPSLIDEASDENFFQDLADWISAPAIRSRP